jgi:hypothetical protein
VIESGSAASRRRTAATLPGIEPDVMVITARREECGAVPHLLHEIKAKCFAVKRDRTGQVCDFEVDVADTRLGMD